MAARKTTDVFQLYVLPAAPIIAAMTAILMFIFAHPVTAGILLIASAILVGTLLALHDRIPRWGRLSLLMLLFVLFAVGACLIIWGIPPTRKGDGEAIRSAQQAELESPPVEETTTGPETIKEPRVTTYDFENDEQGWGEHPHYLRHVSGQGVDVYRNNLSPISKEGVSSLEFTPTNVIDRNAYVTVLEDAQRSKITVHIYVKADADVSLPKAGSTARIIVWDRIWESHESEYVELYSGRWQSIVWDVRKEQFPGPWREFGIHFWFATDYDGPIYIDNVTITTFE